MNFYTIYSKIKSLYSYLILLMGKKKAAPDITYHRAAKNIYVEKESRELLQLILDDILSPIQRFLNIGISQRAFFKERALYFQSQDIFYHMYTMTF